MQSTDTSSPDSSSPCPGASARRFSALRLPLEGPVENMEAAVERLRQCSSTELRRARSRHRRALESLQNGGYSTLSDATRERLTHQLRSNLEALNRALSAWSPEDSPAASAGTKAEAEPWSALFSRVRAFVARLW
jgi:hypothetical protein